MGTIFATWKWGGSMSEMEKDIVTIKIIPEEKKGVEIGMSSIIGTRSNQEDTIFGHEKDGEAVAVVCDGMGGLAGGELASKAAAQSLVEAWFGGEKVEDLPMFLEREAVRADEKIFLQENENGERIRAGTTIVAAIIRKNELYWLSVGDSKIYIIRGEEILSVCREHNYRLTLDQQLEAGELTREEYAAEEYRAEALISYLGMGNVSLMDVNRRPFLLKEGDIVLLSSDGLYKSLAEEEILSVLKENKKDMQAAAKALTTAALGEKKSGQDNTSVVTLRYGGIQKKPNRKQIRNGGLKDEFEKM